MALEGRKNSIKEKTSSISFTCHEVAVTQKGLKCYRGHLLECHTAGLIAEIFYVLHHRTGINTKMWGISRYVSVLTNGTGSPCNKWPHVKQM
jgi:hypothetical protein